jgi:hypothetical protein
MPLLELPPRSQSGTANTGADAPEIHASVGAWEIAYWPVPAVPPTTSPGGQIKTGHTRKARSNNRRTLRRVRFYRRVIGRSFSSPSALAVRQTRGNGWIRRALPLILLLTIVGSALAAGVGSIALWGVAIALIGYGLTMSWIATKYRARSRVGRDVPNWLIGLETFRRYVANEDTTDLASVEK